MRRKSKKVSVWFVDLWWLQFFKEIVVRLNLKILNRIRLNTKKYTELV